MLIAVILSGAIAAHCPSQNVALDAAAGAIERTYVDASQARDIAQVLRHWADSGRYADRCDDVAAFTERLNVDLDAYDGHFLVEAPGTTGDSQDWLMAWRADARSVNAGLREVRVLEGNIGYVRLSTFYPWDLAGAKLKSAFALVGDTDGLILDLRQNGGGDDETADQLVRAFVGGQVDRVQRIERRGETRESPLPEPKLDHYTKPVVVLVDRRTGSAAEFVAYSLQALDRAKVVGGRTGGAASLVGEPIPLAGGFRISIPDARPVNLVTRGNWEKVGVKPDVTGGDDPLFVARQILGAADQ